MKILTTLQIKAWDKFTIQTEPVSSLGLMERAAARCFQEMKVHLMEEFSSLSKLNFQVFCGQGNNGGDGLVIARFLKMEGLSVEVFIVNEREKGSEDFELNLARASAIGIVPQFIDSNFGLNQIKNADVLIDALLGSGLNNPLTGLYKELVNMLNEKPGIKLSVDIPSGLFGDIETAIQNIDSASFKADRTYTFQVPKSSFLFAETAQNVGEFSTINIDLHPDFLVQTETSWNYLQQEELENRKHSKFDFKWQKGHALIVAGSYGKIGAALLAGKACLSTGCGLLTAFTPKVGYIPFQSSFPECMVLTDEEELEIRNFPAITNYNAIGVGPGLGTHLGTQKALEKWLSTINKPIVIDADALNCCAAIINANPDFNFPVNCILTPHAKEFDRLFGASNNAYERLLKAVEMAKKYNITFVLKGAHTQIVSPSGQVFFNSTGNNLLATAGSGDVLTGIITSLLAQGYSTLSAAKKGAFLHGLLADKLQQKGFKNILASDIIKELKFL
ncbi:MAG: NAD(P)H-hydrate dehydratase [Bacteroidia bacterium]|nr:NAD(P)H-hydrate dehydratase [Bacteroidia bacterium]MCF8427612.1 NAD(P)H-hydrate dehydratase [Bacteroidia bacterium]MCF8447636.1 NAD(P)H-hydrate dehydratase [Bacteroidia bacterium]